MNPTRAGWLRPRWLFSRRVAKVLLWTVAHLLVNGDTPSFVLFGGIGLWAVLQMLAINRAGPWVPPAAKPAKLEIFAVLGTVLVYGAIAGVHYALGYPSFG